VVARRPEMDRLETPVPHPWGRRSGILQLDYLLASSGADAQQSRPAARHHSAPGSAWRTLFPDGQESTLSAHAGWDAQGRIIASVAMTFRLI